MNSPESDYKEKIRRIKFASSKSLKFLCIEVLGMKDWGAVHDELEAFLKSSGKRKHIELPRGHLKSSFITKAWSMQQVLNNPDIRILLANSVWDNSRKFLRSIQKYLGRGSILNTVYGNFESEHWNQDECTVFMRKVILDAPTWATTGIEKEQTSQHYDLIIGDDLVARENVSTPEQRQKVKLYYKDLLDLLEPEGTLVIVGTRWHQDDLYGKILEEPGWDYFIRSAYNPDGSVLFPQKFSIPYLEQLRATKGSYEFACQYLNSPIDESISPFKQSMIRFYDAGTLPQMSYFLTIDPALTQKIESDWTGMVVAGMDAKRNIYVVDRIRRQMRPSQIVDCAFDLVDKWKIRRVGVESYGYQLALKYDMQSEQRKRGKFFTVEEMRKPKGFEKKESFILRLEPYFEQGLVHLRRDMTDLVDEIIAFPRAKHDDLLDALAYQLDYLMPSNFANATAGLAEGTWGHWAREHVHAQAMDWQKKFFEDLSEPRGADLV